MKKDDVSGSRILLVDDNERGLTARGMILADHGYVIETAQSGEAAWDLIQKQHFDVVVTDSPHSRDGFPGGYHPSLGLHRLPGNDAAVDGRRRINSQEQQGSTGTSARGAEACGASAKKEACVTGQSAGRERLARRLTATAVTLFALFVDQAGALKPLPPQRRNPRRRLPPLRRRSSLAPIRLLPRAG